jgi:nicotinamide mononucleotide transporter
MEMMHALQTWWWHQTWLEVFAVITGLLCVYLAAVNNIWNWPFAIVSVALYIVITAKAQLYADMGLQFYFLAMNIYGWYYWSHKPETQDKTPVRKIAGRQIVISALAILITTPVLGYALVYFAPILHYQPASFPYLDSFCTACSVVAQVLLARKVLENWLIWIFVDVLYVGIYFLKDLHLTALMYAIYVVIVTIGYLDWKKEVKLQSL